MTKEEAWGFFFLGIFVGVAMSFVAMSFFLNGC